MGLHEHFWTAAVLLSISILKHADNVSGQFTGTLLACPGDTFTYKCTVLGDRSGITIWRVGTSDECTLVHRSTSSSICGPNDAFTAAPGTGFGNISATSFSSTLNGTATSALDGTLVECFGPGLARDAENRVGHHILQMIGSPSVPNISCVDLSEEVSGVLNVTVSWTLSGGGSADFYLISITTNAPQIPYGGLLNITTGSVTQHELTGFMPGYEYNITIHGVNCVHQRGNESKPLTITPQVPMVPSSCNITLSYDQSSRRLQFIDTTWRTVPDPVNPEEACPGVIGAITHYQISFHTASFAATENIMRCTARRCSHTFEPPSNPPSTYDSVSVAAQNVMGVGAAKTCTTQSIGASNNLLTGKIIDASSLNDVTIICIFLSGFTGSAQCTVRYGTDPTYMNLPYSAESTETGTAGDTVSVVLRERLNSSTVYYYTVSAVSGDVTVRVQATFTTLWCSLTDLASSDAVRVCTDRGFNVNTMTIPSNATCNSRTAAESQVVYICDNEDGAARRVCQSYWIWNGSIPQCSPNPGGQDGTVCPPTNGATGGIVVATATVVAFIAGALAGALLFYCISKHRSHQHFKPEPPLHQEQKAISSSNPLQQTGPVYEEMIELRKNIVYESTQTGIEMRANEAYGPMHH